MDNPATAVTDAAKKAFKLPLIVQFLLLFILINLGLDILSLFWPLGVNLIMRPFSTIKALVKAKTGGASSQ